MSLYGFNAQPSANQHLAASFMLHDSLCPNYKLMFSHVCRRFFVSGNSLAKGPYLRIGHSNVLLAMMKSRTGLHLPLSLCDVNQDVQALWRLTSKHGNDIRNWIRPSTIRVGDRTKSDCQIISILKLVGSSGDQWVWGRTKYTFGMCIYCFYILNRDELGNRVSFRKRQWCQRSFCCAHECASQLYHTDTRIQRILFLLALVIVMFSDVQCISLPFNRYCHVMNTLPCWFVSLLPYHFMTW